MSQSLISGTHHGLCQYIFSGIGGLIMIPLASFWGRAPLMFWTTLAGALFTLASTVTHSFSVFYGFRALQGITLNAYQVVGLACIKDMFFLTSMRGRSESGSHSSSYLLMYHHCWAISSLPERGIGELSSGWHLALSVWT